MRIFYQVTTTGMVLGSIPSVVAKSLWSDSPGDYGNFITTAFPLGNGRLGAMPMGAYGKEIVNLNVDSLWRGGPFEDQSYSGGNPNASKAEALPGIRDFIFRNGTGDVDALLGDSVAYGSYQVLGNLTIDMGEELGAVYGYKRSLDLESGVYTDHFHSSGAYFERQAFCSYPDQVCVYRIQSSSALPPIKFGLENRLITPSPWVECQENSLILSGETLKSIGIKYYARATVVVPGARHGGIDLCAKNNSMISVSGGYREAFVVLAAGTNYDASKGNAAASFSFKGEDPEHQVSSTVSEAARKSYSHLKSLHVRDFQSLMGRFTLSLPDPDGSAQKPTAELITNYTQPGNPFVENLLFDYGRYLFISASRPGSLPPNLQGIWTQEESPAWSADYHANINLQMNHWGVEQTGLGDQTEPLWNYMIETWMPRGAETARLLYGTLEGWVTHNEMNVFGHTAMKNGAQWANYPVVNAWMCQHVWDHFDYTQNITWYRHIGYPILKGTAQFWLSQLVQDEYFHDGTWVVNPCNSPEHGPTTFGCTHYQQLIWEVFSHVLRGWDASGDTDLAFRAAISSKLASLDAGIHIGSWGQIQEWKLDLDVRNDPHRHLSNLYGWYPGFSISSIHGDNLTITQAVETTLLSRGLGVEDQNTGWAKIWRSACWALLGNVEKAYELLTLAIQNNFFGNGLDMYSGNPPLQIDANYGILGAVVSMLVRDLDDTNGSSSSRTSEQKVVLGPAIPTAWGGGSVSGLRLRGGGQVQFGWDKAGVVDWCKVNLKDRGEDQPVLTFSVRGGKSIQCSSHT